MTKIKTVVSGLSFAEAPRWHDGALYIADMFGNRVLRIKADGDFSVAAQFNSPVSGIGWLPDGRMLVVAMHERQVLREEGSGFVVHADLSKIATHHANDMIVAADGTAYVGNFGFSIKPLRFPRRAVLAMVTVDGGVSKACKKMWFPNGMAITPDGRTLIVAESGAFRLLAFDVGDAGILSNRRTWAQFKRGHAPDGICIDEEGAAWVALAHQKQFVRVHEGGAFSACIDVPDTALACVLGGDDRKTLYMMTSADLDPEKCVAKRSAKVLAMTVDIPGAGRP